MTAEKVVEKKRLSTPIPDGAFEKITLLLKPIFLEETTGVGDTEFWIEREEKAGECKLTLKQIAMHYYLRNIGHITLSEMIVGSFPAYRGNADISEKQKEQIRDSLSWKILESYPPKYRKNFNKRIEKKTTFEDDGTGIPF